MLYTKKKQPLDSFKEALVTSESFMDSEVKDRSNRFRLRSKDTIESDQFVFKRSKR